MVPVTSALRLGVERSNETAPVACAHGFQPLQHLEGDFYDACHGSMAAGTHTHPGTHAAERLGICAGSDCQCNTGRHAALVAAHCEHRQPDQSSDSGSKASRALRRLASSRSALRSRCNRRSAVGGKRRRALGITPSSGLGAAARSLRPLAVK